MKILINALPGNGDALMFTPSLKILREKYPDSEIHLLVMFRSVAEMFGNSPYINYIHFIDFLNQSKLSSFKEILKLRKNNFDVSVNIYPTNRAEYNILGFLTGAKKTNCVLIH